MPDQHHRMRDRIVRNRKLARYCAALHMVGNSDVGVRRDVYRVGRNAEVRGAIRNPGMDVRPGAARITRVGDANVADDRVMSARSERNRVGRIRKGIGAKRSRGEAGGQEANHRKPQYSVEISHFGFLGYCCRTKENTRETERSHRAYLKQVLFVF